MNTTNTPPVALVTGASKRLGRAMVEHLHSKGYCVIVHYGTDTAAANTLAQQLNALRRDSAQAIPANLSNPSDIKSLADSCLDCWGRLDVLINNASMFKADTTQFDAALWQQQNAVNTMAPYALSRYLQPALTESKGNIINMVDIYAERPLHAHHSYCASKAGVGMLVKSLAIELAPDVRVNGIAPGAILWPELPSDENNSDYQQALLNKIPLQRLGSIQAIVSALAFILDCDYLDGQVINIDGGRSITI